MTDNSIIMIKELKNVNQKNLRCRISKMDRCGLTIISVKVKVLMFWIVIKAYTSLSCDRASVEYARQCAEELRDKILADETL